MRYVLVDYMHLVHRCMMAQPLSATIKIGNEVQTVDTTIPTYTLKNIFRYSDKGHYYTGVFFEGGSSWRKKYFSDRENEGYKGNRGSLHSAVADGVNLAINLMVNAKMSLYRIEHMEADDIIYSMVQKIKSVDKDTPIDIITNDSDLLPLVDEQVSVYIRGTRQFACDGCPERRLYYQVTPETWYDYLAYTSQYKKFYIPFNSMFLYKMLRGDKSDNVPAAVKGYGGVKYSKLMEQMVADGVDFPNIFKYGVDFEEIMKPVLKKYFDDEDIAKIKYNHDGLDMKYVDLKVPLQIEPGYLQSAVSPLQINIVK